MVKQTTASHFLHEVSIRLSITHRNLSFLGSIERYVVQCTSDIVVVTMLDHQERELNWTVGEERLK
jgi:hypothetical protein